MSKTHDGEAPPALEGAAPAVPGSDSASRPHAVGAGAATPARPDPSEPHGARPDPSEPHGARPDLAEPDAEPAPPQVTIPRGAVADTSRVDVWLWAVRIFPTRSKSAAACRAGHVRVNGERAKSATSVKPGDGVEVRGLDRPRILIVREALIKRVGAPIARVSYEDHSPPPPPKDVLLVPKRLPGSGRPTKKERRDITRLRGY